MAFFIKQGDRLPVATAVLQQPAGTPVNLSGATVAFYMAHTNGLASVSGIATISTAALGIVEYHWGASDTAIAGEYMAEFEITFGSGKKQTVPNGEYEKVEIRQQLG